ncbi:hypothetical protein [Streptomyces zingiberis]|uniref:Secreted protein n=1 Tax=Streptomyces zingiberis TaxID=2053010 RepID=A0ABX1C4X1_9ACTN|nr:hypothetical protein [Streptomyces zingiberis]NJQ03680.1 hypothetical protein [Streptomyces zingiberis]
MSRGRHRHSPPLHRLLPPSTVIGVAAACAVGALLTGDPAVLRALVVAAAVAAATGAVLMRVWDRAAGKQVADLHRARTRDEWRAEERIAELETDVEEFRTLRAEMETKLRAKRTELARLRNEHAGLLRRYATAETERASALEGRRLLAIEAGPSHSTLGAGGAPTPATYLRASEALRRLARNGARQQAQRTVEEARRRDTEQAARDEREESDQPRGRHAAGSGQADGPADGAGRGAAGTPAVASRGQGPVPAASAVAPYEPRRGATSRAEGGFDFFGTQSARAAHHSEPQAAAGTPDEQAGPVSTGGPEAPAEGAAGPVGQEAAGTAEAAERTDRPARPEPRQARRRQAARRAETPRAGKGGPQPLSQKPPMGPQPPRQADGGGEPGEPVEPEHALSEAGEVIDLTEHDETEQLNLRALRAHSS